MRALVAVGLLLVAGCSSAKAERPVGKPQVESSDPTLEGNVVRIDGRTYHCIKYTTVDRGGLWCDHVDG